MAQTITGHANEAELRRLIRTKGIASLIAEAWKKAGYGFASFDEPVPVGWL